MWQLSLQSFSKSFESSLYLPRNFGLVIISRKVVALNLPQCNVQLLKTFIKAYPPKHIRILTKSKSLLLRLWYAMVTRCSHTHSYTMMIVTVQIKLYRSAHWIQCSLLFVFILFEVYVIKSFSKESLQSVKICLLPVTCSQMLQRPHVSNVHL